ncbi:isochorismatase family protein [Rhizobium sp. TH2]|nr:isochorismatase family protein [Rhizobium sp. TH2]
MGGGLDLILRRNAVETLVITGGETDVCVEDQDVRFPFKLLTADRLLPVPEQPDGKAPSYRS